MLGAADAPLQWITHQVQGPEDTVAEEHRAGEQYGQLLTLGGFIGGPILLPETVTAARPS